MKAIALLSLILTAPIYSWSQMSELFSRISMKDAGISFMNELVEDENLNYFLEDDLYNGSGVAVGDINNDGLDDIYFVSNFGHDQLYLNKGNFQFENITESAFEKTYEGVWKSGACMADINADGYLDIYVCRRGTRLQLEEERRNLVFINTGKNTFIEYGKELGLDDPGRTSDVGFFDYDQDGDLDVLLVNRRQNTSVMEQFMRQTNLEKGHSNKLYRNDNGTFTDVTSFKNGIESYGFCFDVSISDVNGDGWPDLYITNDYDLPDFFLINDQNGGFENQTNSRLGHTSQYSMGSDIADFNNDGLMDLMILDMSNFDYAKSKTNMGSMSVADFWDRVRRGYPYQYMYNTLQLNLGMGHFSEIAHLAGIASTDWSWGPLLADFDQDGYKDLFITNGYLREVRDQDFTQLLRDYMDTNPEGFDVEMMLEKIPQTKEVNYIFKNKGDLTFENKSQEWGMNFGSVSHGAAYSDLDNDGDLDLVVNNLNEEPIIMKNNSGEKNFLKVVLKGPEKNQYAVGAKVTLISDLGTQVQEVYPSRGYASSSSYTLCFGLGQDEFVRSLQIDWNSKEQSTIKKIGEVNQTIIADYAILSKTDIPEFPSFPQQDNVFLDVSEYYYDDYKREILLPHKMSQLGPFLSAGDATGDNIEDIYVGGGKGISGRFLYALKEGQMINKPMPAFDADRDYEDGRSVFFDADLDGDLDLYVVSGGNEYPAGDERYQDRLYINTGSKSFVRDTSALPKINASGEVVALNDIDLDGDLDLFVGGRQTPGQYPKAPRSYWLINEGGKFTDKIDEIAPDIKQAGMITDVEFVDLNADGRKDMIVCGEWMEIQIYLNQEGTMERWTDGIADSKLKGWWNCIEVADLDKNGIPEFLVGNLGLNNKFHPNSVHGLRIYLEDFDSNGSLDIVLSKFFGGLEHPVRGKECLSDQMPQISERFKTFNEFAAAEFGELFPTSADPLSVDNFASGMFKMKNGVYEFIPFPNMGQLGPINDFVQANINGDEYIDFVAVGNRYEAEIETPRYDGNPGLALLGQADGSFDILPIEVGGNFANRNAKDALRVGRTIYISNSGESINKIELFFD